jgi:ubiquinone biosynthesis protein
MLSPKRIPTTLIDHQQRAPIPLIRPRALPRFRGLRVFWSFAKVMAGLGWLRLRGKLTGEIAGKRMRTFLEHQGFLWVKLGQVLSLQTDVFSADFCRELSKLQFQARGFPFDLARQTVEEGVGGPIDQVFAEFDEKPFAAASISQVHRAVLKKNGALVVVKVQRPDVPAIFGSDMNILRSMIWMIQLLRADPAERWEDLQEELAQTVREEIDYRHEISNLRRMRKSLRPHRIYVPKVFEEVSNWRVLVMEYIQGALMSDFITLRRTAPERVTAWLQENNVSAETVGRRVYLSFLRQLFEDNLLHGDLHPGNIILLRDSNVAFIDLGTVGTLETQLLLNYASHLHALSTGQYGRAADLTLLGCTDLPVVDVVEVKRKLMRVYKDWSERSTRRGVPYKERSMENMGVQANQVLVEANIMISLQYLKIGRTLATMDASLANLIPNAKYTQLMQQYFKGAQKRAAKNRRRRRNPTAIRDTLESISGVAGLARTMLNRGVLSFRGDITKLAFCIGTICHSLRLGVGLIGVAWCLLLLERYFAARLPAHPLGDWFQRVTRNSPGPVDSRWQFLAALALTVTWLWLGKLERWWLAREARLPSAEERTSAMTHS